MRVLVCGGRNFSDQARLVSILDEIHRVRPIGCVIEGDARGADRMAGYWARKKRIDNLKFRAEWKVYGKAAGAIRNQKMLETGNPDLVIAFPGGRGTADMVKRATMAGIEVINVAGGVDGGNVGQSRCLVGGKSGRVPG